MENKDNDRAQTIGDLDTIAYVRYELELTWVHFPLHPETPPEGRRLDDLFAGREAALAEMKARLVEVAAAEGLPIADRDSTYNSRLAQELGAWADTRDDGGRIHDAVDRDLTGRPRPMDDGAIRLRRA